VNPFRVADYEAARRFISLGALTHSARAVDITFEVDPN
jgi:nicotinate-nucleotide pyrophosphorylase